MYTLYYSPGACSLAVHVLLQELKLPFELVEINLGERKHRTKDYLAINPRSQVPALVGDGVVLLESAAIMLYLMEKHGSAWLPISAMARAKAVEWLLFCNSTLHQAYIRSFFFLKTIKDAEQLRELLVVNSKAISRLWSNVEEQLLAHPYIAGEALTAADILLTVIANWSFAFPDAPITIGERTKQHLKHIASLPSFVKAMEREGVSYKVV